MKILLADLDQSEKTYTLSNKDWFPADEFTVADGPRGQATAMLTGSNEAMIKGRLRCEILSSCDRCCAAVKLKLAADFAYICLIGSEEYEQGHQETECRVEDYDRLYLKEPVIDLGEMFREQVYLSIPSQILCDKSCQGLCQACGTDLNQNRCDCDQSKLDSPFAVLRQLKNH